jgi:DNA-directed RNA polymerase specialized sigma24 family protein
MTNANDTTSFEARLTPVLSAAYSVAWYLTNDTEQTERLLEDAVSLACSAFRDRPVVDSYTMWFLGILCDHYVRQDLDCEAVANLTVWEEAADLGMTAMPPRHGRAARGADEDSGLDALEPAEVATLFARMPVIYRIICVLYFLEGLSYAEIAVLAGCTREVARTRLHRGLRWLRYAAHASRSTRIACDPEVHNCERPYHNYLFHGVNARTPY